MKQWFFMCVACMILPLAANEGESSPRRRPLSIPRVYDQAPRVVQPEQLFQADPGPGAGRAELLERQSGADPVSQSMRPEIPVPRVAPLTPVMAPVEDGRREREGSQSWIRPIDLLGENDQPPVEAGEGEPRTGRGAETELLDWATLREAMSARERTAPRPSEDTQSASGTDRGNPAFSLRDRERDSGTLQAARPVPPGGEDSLLSREGARSSAGTPAFQSAMRMEPVGVPSRDPVLSMRGETDLPGESSFRRESPFASAPAPAAESGFRSGFAADFRPSIPEPARIDPPRAPSVSSAPAFSASTAAPSSLPSADSLRTALPAASPQAPPAMRTEIRRFRQDEFSVRPADPWSSR